MPRYLLWSATLLLVAACGSRKPAAHSEAGAHADVGALEDADAGDSADTPPEVSGAEVSAVGSFVADSLVLRPDGHVLVGGTMTGTVDLGLGPVTSDGESDLLVAELLPSGKALWNRRFGDADRQGGAMLALDSAGNLYMATTFLGSLNLGGERFVSAGYADVALVKLDSAGNHVWSQRWGDAGQQLGIGLTVDASDDVVLSIDTDAFYPAEGTVVLALKPTGDLAWTKPWRGVDRAVLATSAAGNPLLAGAFRNTVDVGGGPLSSAGLEDLILVELTQAGDWVWNKRFGGYGTDSTTAVAVDATGHILLTGSFDDTLDFGGEPLVSVRAANRFAPSRDVFVAKLDAAGTPLWGRRFGDAAFEEGSFAIAATSGAGAVVIGAGSSWIDFGLGQPPATGPQSFVTALDSDGHARWSHQFPRQTTADVRMTSTNDAVLVAGGFATDTQVGPTLQRFMAGGAAFLIKYAP